MRGENQYCDRRTEAILDSGPWLNSVAGGPGSGCEQVCAGWDGKTGAVAIDGRGQFPLCCSFRFRTALFRRGSMYSNLPSLRLFVSRVWGAIEENNRSEAKWKSFELGGMECVGFWENLLTPAPPFPGRPSPQFGSPTFRACPLTAAAKCRTCVTADLLFVYLKTPGATEDDACHQQTPVFAGNLETENEQVPWMPATNGKWIAGGVVLWRSPCQPRTAGSTARYRLPEHS